MMQYANRKWKRSCQRDMSTQNAYKKYIPINWRYIRVTGNVFMIMFYVCINFMLETYWCVFDRKKNCTSRDKEHKLWREWMREGNNVKRFIDLSSCRIMWYVSLNTTRLIFILSIKSFVSYQQLLMNKIIQLSTFLAQRKIECKRMNVKIT